MKFHNQKSFMGHEISNVTNKPLLHKKGKQWIVVAVSALILAGFGGVVSTTTHADTTNNGAQTESAASGQANGNSASSTSNTQNQAKALHLNLLQNADAQKPSNTNSNSSLNDKPVVHMLGNTSSYASDNHITHSGNQRAEGNWGNATWNLYSDGQLDIHDGSMNNINAFNGYGGATTTNASTHTLNPNDVKSIYTYNVTAPSDSMNLFSGNTGHWTTGGGEWNHFNHVESIDLSGLNTSDVTNMAGMFHGDAYLEHINFGGSFNTNKVTSMATMFDDCSRIQSLDLNAFDTSNCTDFHQMFYNTPSLQLLDLSKFIIKQGDSVGNMFAMNQGNFSDPSPRHAPALKQLVLNNSFTNLTSDAELNSTSSGIDTSNKLTQIDQSTPSTSTDWSYTYKHPGNWAIGSDTYNYTVTFINELNSDKSVGQTNITGLAGAKTLPIGNITMPTSSDPNNSNYQIDYSVMPNNGTTINVQNGKGFIPVYQAAITTKGPNPKIIESTSASGTWGDTSWRLTNSDNLVLMGGKTTKGLSDTMETSTVPSDLVPYEDQIKTISTANNVVAPHNSFNLFGDFPNVTKVDLGAFNDTSSANTNDMLSNSVREVILGPNSKLNITGGLQAYNNDFGKATGVSDSVPNKYSDIGDGTLNHQGTWFIDYAGTMNSEASADAQSAEDAANTSASGKFTSASNWVSNNSNSAQSADSWVASNSASESNASASASNNSGWIHTNSASLNSASTSASDADKWVHGNSASVSANSNWIKDNFGSLASAYNSATSAMNSLNSDSSELNWLNSSEGSISSDDNWIHSNSSELNNLNGNWQSVNSRISTDEGNLNNAINAKADSSSLTTDVNNLDNDIRTASGIAAQAEQLANTNAANINTNSANASNSAKNAEINAFGEAYVNNQVVAASVVSSIANTVDSINTHIGSSYASAIASAQNLAGSAKTSAEAQAQTDAKSAFSSASSYANNLSSAASNSISASEKAMNTNMAKNSANDSSSVASLSGSANTASASASKGISSNAKNISNNSNNINTNSNTASNGISNANASASASASVASSNAQSVANKNSASASASVSAANSEAQSLANQNSLSASISAANANSNADAYALSLANNAINTTNTTAGGIDNTMSSNDQTVQSLSNTVSNNTISLANNDNDLYMTKENKSDHKQEQQPQQVVSPQIRKVAYLYVLKPVWLHTSAKFTKHNRAKALTAKHGYTLPITKVFRVHGALRFEVKMNGKHYFVTGQKKFTRNAYIQPNEINHHSSVKLLQNIREYKKAGFGDKNFIRNFKKGAILPVKRAVLISSKRMTRLQLTNGHWITANKNLVKLI